MKVSPSRIAAQAAGLVPRSLATAPEAGRCAMCGVSHAQGDPVVPFLPPATFMDYSALRGAGQDFMCIWCDVVWCREFSQTHLKSVICSDGVFPAASNDHIAYWLLNPPKGDWLFLSGDQKVQHLVFRAPVNQSQDVYQVKMGESVLTIRKDYLERGVVAARALAQVATEIRQRTSKRGSPVKSPFVALSRDCDALSQGLIRNELLVEARASPQVGQWIDTIRSLTPGELWGLTAVLYAVNPHRPEKKSTVTA